jgi:DNA ligase (NAD+)
MLSLKDAFSENDIHKFIINLENEHGKLSYFTELKYDGASMNLQYSNGKLKAAITRGDGLEGEEVTEAAKTIRGIPHSIADSALPADCEIRGEVMMSFDTFDRQNLIRVMENKEPFANPRNAASGSLRQLNIGEVARRGLFFVPYELKADVEIGTQHELSELLDYSDLFNAVELKRLCHSAEEVIEAFSEMKNKRSSLPFGIDGIVIKVDNRNIQSVIGTAKKYPKWALAAKFEPQEMTTKLLNVEFQVGKHGISPVAILSPINIDGSVVTKATLHNFDEIQRLGLMINDTVAVVKRGDIIPSVERTYPERRNGSEVAIVKPTHCPSCNSVLVPNILKDKTEGSQLLCPNNKCTAKASRYLAYIADRSVLNIDGLGLSVAEKLVETLQITDVLGLKHLSVDKAMTLVGFGQKSATKLVNNIQKALESVYLDRFIVLLQAPDIGRTISKELAGELGIGALDPEIVEKYTLSGTSNDVFKGYARLLRERNEEIALMVKTLNPKVLPVQEIGSEAGIFKGLKIVLTGKLEQPRKHYAELIENNGGIFLDKISKEVDVLVMAQIDSGSSKAKNAEKMGIRIVTASDFFAPLYVA